MFDIDVESSILNEVSILLMDDLGLLEPSDVEDTEED
jgi:hypothetical protein